MADELKTGLVLDLNTKEIESDLANFTSEINKVIAEIGKIQSEMDKLGPKAGESFKDMGATFGKLLQSMRTTAQNMSNAMIDKAAFSDTKTELDHIIARLTDVETRLKTALNPQAINDMMNALQKLNDVFGRINLGKLEVTFKNMESSFENISTKLSEVIDKAKDISDALAKIDLSKLRQDDSSTEAESKKSTEALKEEAKAASMTADAWDKVRKARAQAVKNTKEQSVSRERNQLEDLRRFAAEEAFGDAVPDDKQVDIS